MTETVKASRVSVSFLIQCLLRPHHTATQRRRPSHTSDITLLRIHRRRYCLFKPKQNSPANGPMRFPDRVKACIEVVPDWLVEEERDAVDDDGVWAGAGSRPSSIDDPS